MLDDEANPNHSLWLSGSRVIPRIDLELIFNSLLGPRQSTTIHHAVHAVSSL